MEDYDKNKELSYIQLYIQYWQYQDLNNLYGQPISQKLPLNNFEWIKGTSHFMKIS